MENNFDFLYVLEGDLRGTQLARYTGTTASSLTSTGEILTLHMTTDSSMNQQGFEIVVEFVGMLTIFESLVECVGMLRNLGIILSLVICLKFCNRGRICMNS